MPLQYTYDDYLGSQRRIGAAQMPSSSSHTQRTINDPVWNATNGPGTNTYTPGQTNREYVRENLGFGGNQYSAQNMAMGLLNPVGGAFAGAKAYGHYKTQRREYRQQQERFKKDVARAQASAGTNWLNTLDPTSRTAQLANQRLNSGQALSDEELNASLRMEDQNSRRAGYEREVDGYFGSAERSGWQEGIVQNRLQNDLANVQEDYGNNLRSSVQGAAARGLKGGSVDVEGRGAVARTRDTQAIQAGSAADAARSNFRSNDQQARAQLLGLVNSGDIGDADALRSQLEGIHSATTSAAADYAGQQQRRQIDQFGRQQQSQAWGSGLNSIANYIDRNPQQSQSWFGGSTSRGGW